MSFFPLAIEDSEQRKVTAEGSYFYKKKGFQEEATLLIHQLHRQGAMSCATAVMYTPYSPYNTNSSLHHPGGLFPGDKHPSDLLEDNNNARSSHLEDKLLVAQVVSSFKMDSPGESAAAASHHTSTVSSSQSSPRPPSILNEEDSCDSSISAHRLASNVIVFTHYVGDASSVVEDHFSRALNYEPEKNTPCCKPMSARNLPASFWTAPSELSSPSSPPRGSIMQQQLHPGYGEHLYPESITGALHQLAADWSYPPSMAAQPSTHPSTYSSNYTNYASRFQPSNYWPPPHSPRLPPVVGGSSSTNSSVKSEWSPEPPYDYGPVHGAPHHHHVPYHHHYSNISAAVGGGSLDPSPAVGGGELNKPATTDLFWTTSF